MHRDRRRCGLCLTSHTRLAFPPAVDSLPRSVDRAGCHLAQQEWYRPCSSCHHQLFPTQKFPNSIAHVRELTSRDRNAVDVFLSSVFGASVERTGFTIESLTASSDVLETALALVQY